VKLKERVYEKGQKKSRTLQTLKTNKKANWQIKRRYKICSF
jgi:hypothetical protein